MDPEDWLVKRVVGLPGESVEIEFGDIYANGSLQSKSLQEFRQIAVPVLDTTSTSGGAANAAWQRWRPRHDSPPGWRWERGTYVGCAGIDGLWSWLDFQGCDSPGTRHAVGCIVDNYAYNQSVSRPVHQVRDVLLRCGVREFRRGEFACRVAVDGQTAEVVWDVAERRVAFRVNGALVEERWLPRVHRARAPTSSSPCATVRSTSRSTTQISCLPHCPLLFRAAPTGCNCWLWEFGVAR